MDTMPPQEKKCLLKLLFMPILLRYVAKMKLDFQGEWLMTPDPQFILLYEMHFFPYGQL